MKILMTILDASTDAAVIIDASGAIVKVTTGQKKPDEKKKIFFFVCPVRQRLTARRQVNKACERMFGYSQAELTGKNVKLLMPEPYSLHHDGYIERFHRTHVGHIGACAAACVTKTEI